MEKMLLAAGLLSFALSDCKAVEEQLAPATEKSKFSFAIIADQQVGNANNINPTFKNASTTFADACAQINKNKNIAFTISLGDIVNSYEPKSVSNFVNIAKTLEKPLYLVHGNHDSRFPYTEYKQMSRDLTGIDKMYYSFDAGEWHFVVMPAQIDKTQALMKNSAYAEYVNGFTQWLKEDMAKNKKRPTAVFEHFHLIPLGMTQLDWYTFTRNRRMELLDIITSYGNVKYYFNGHIHNGIRPSVKMTRTYKGTTFITVPTIILSRPLSDEFPEYVSGDKTGGYYMTVDVVGDKFTLWGHLSSVDKPYKYPATFAAIDDKTEPRWFRSIPEFTPAESLVNGNFAKGLSGWYQTFRYQSDNTPPYICKVLKVDNKNAAELGVTAVMPEMWGKDELTEIYQVVKAPNNPTLNADVRIPSQIVAAGAYVRVAAMNESGLAFMVFFRFGNKADEYNSDFLPRSMMVEYTNTESASWSYLTTLAKEKRAMFVDVPYTSGKWVNMSINLSDLYFKATGKYYIPLKIDRFYIGLGTWAGNKEGSKSLADFANISLAQGAGKVLLIDGKEPDLSSIFETRFGQNITDNQKKVQLKKK